MFSEFGVGFGFDVDARSTRHVVKNRGDVDIVGNLRVVRDESGLRAFVVIRRDEQNSIDADLRRVLRQLNRVGGVVRAGARNDGDASVDMFNGEFYCGASFMVAASPVVPVIQIASVWLEIWSSIIRPSSAKFMPVSSNGVTIATHAPLNGNCFINSPPS